MTAGRPALGISTDRAAIRIGMEAGRPPRWTYRVAATDLHANAPLPQLTPFLLDDEARGPSDADDEVSSTFLPFEAWPLRWSGTVWLGGRRRRLTCRGRNCHSVLRVSGAPDVGVDTESGCIVALSDTAAGSRDRLLSDVVTGPALALALAGKGIYCLHASAVAIDGRARLFVGESGVGKSTLVAGPPAGVRLLADDILPVAFDDVAPRALLPFPQLKVAVAGQPGNAGPSALPLDAVVVLEATPPADWRLVRRRRLSAVEATLALSRHTVAAKLFDRSQLERHLAFCASLAAAVPVLAAAFHRDLGRLNELRAELLA